MTTYLPTRYHMRELPILTNGVIVRADRDVNKTAVISACERYRYHLGREFSAGAGTCLFVMLNPSKANADIDDPTIRKCMKFAQTWGYQKLAVVNLFAWRETSPEAMKLADEPIGPKNFEFVSAAALAAEIVICAWGKHGSHRGQGDALRRLLGHNPLVAAKLHYLRLNGDGSPQHPLYIPGAAVPTPWEAAQP